MRTLTTLFLAAALLFGIRCLSDTAYALRPEHAESATGLEELREALWKEAVRSSASIDTLPRTSGEVNGQPKDAGSTATGLEEEIQSGGLAYLWALHIISEALKTARRISDSYIDSRSIALAEVAAVLAQLGQDPSTIFAEALATARKTGNIPPPLKSIVNSQIQAGLLSEALTTAREIQYEPDRVKAFAAIAAAQARANQGDAFRIFSEAITIAKNLPSLADQLSCFATIVNSQSECGYLREAEATIQEARASGIDLFHSPAAIAEYIIRAREKSPHILAEALNYVRASFRSSPYYRNRALLDIAVVEARVGKDPSATLAEAFANAISAINERKDKDIDHLRELDAARDAASDAVFLVDIAKAQLQLGADYSNTLAELLELLPKGRYYSFSRIDHGEFLASLAEIYSHAGNFKEAIVTARRIKAHVSYDQFVNDRLNGLRSHVFASIAVALAQAGDLTQALSISRMIKFSDDLAYALGAIAIARAKLLHFLEAYETLRKIKFLTHVSIAVSSIFLQEANSKDLPTFFRVALDSTQPTPLRQAALTAMVPHLSTLKDKGRFTNLERYQLASILLSPLGGRQAIFPGPHPARLLLAGLLPTFLKGQNPTLETQLKQVQEVLLTHPETPLSFGDRQRFNRLLDEVASYEKSQLQITQALPRPAGPPGPSIETLPRTTGESLPSTDTLPRTPESEAEDSTGLEEELSPAGLAHLWTLRFISEALATARKEKDPVVLATVASAQAQIGQDATPLITQALTYARDYTNTLRIPHGRVGALCAIAKAQASAGQDPVPTFQEALAYAKENTRDQFYYRDVSEIATAQAQANLFTEALALVREELRGDHGDEARVKIAQAQANAGQFSEALATAGEIVSAKESAKAFTEIAIAQVKASQDPTQALEEAKRAARRIGVVYWGSTEALAAIANVQAQGGLDFSATLNEALSAARRSEPGHRGVALTIVAQLQTQLGLDPTDTLKEALTDVREAEDWLKGLALVRIAEAYAKARRFDEAFGIVREINEAFIVPTIFLPDWRAENEAKSKLANCIRSQNLALAAIASAQGEAGLFKEALATAREVWRRGPYPHYSYFEERDDALAAIGTAQVQAGMFAEALTTAQKIGRGRRATLLSNLSLLAFKAGKSDAVRAFFRVFLDQRQPKGLRLAAVTALADRAEALEDHLKGEERYELFLTLLGPVGGEQWSGLRDNPVRVILGTLLPTFSKAQDPGLKQGLDGSVAQLKATPNPLSFVERRNLEGLLDQVAPVERAQFQQFKTLPRPAGPPDPSIETLPRTTGKFLPTTDTLPRTTESEAGESTGLEELLELPLSDLEKLTQQNPDRTMVPPEGAEGMMLLPRRTEEPPVGFTLFVPEGWLEIARSQFSDVQVQSLAEMKSDSVGVVLLDADGKPVELPTEHLVAIRLHLSELSTLSPPILGYLSTYPAFRSRILIWTADSARPVTYDGREYLLLWKSA